MVDNDESEKQDDMMRWLSSMDILLQWLHEDDQSYHTHIQHDIRRLERTKSYGALRQKGVWLSLERACSHDKHIPTAYIRTVCNACKVPFHDMYAINMDVIERIRDHWFDDKNADEVYCYKYYVVAHLVKFIHLMRMPTTINEFTAMMIMPHPLTDHHQPMYISLGKKQMMKSIEWWRYDGTNLISWLGDDDMYAITGAMVSDMVSFETFHSVMGYRMFAEPYGDRRYVAVIESGGSIADDPAFGYEYMDYFPYISSIIDSMIHEHASYADAFHESASLIDGIIKINEDMDFSSFNGIPMLTMSSLRALDRKPLHEFSEMVQSALGRYGQLKDYYATGRMDDIEWMINQDGMDDDVDYVLAYDVFMNALGNNMYNDITGNQIIDDINYCGGIDSSLCFTTAISAVSTRNHRLFRIAELLSSITRSVNDEFRIGENMIMLRKDDVRAMFNMLYHHMPYALVMQWVFMTSEEHKNHDKQIHGSNAGNFILCSKDGS
jgi:hypothetical protein